MFLSLFLPLYVLLDVLYPFEHLNTVTPVRPFPWLQNPHAVLLHFLLLSLYLAQLFLSSLNVEGQWHYFLDLNFVYQAIFGQIQK